MTLNGSWAKQHNSFSPEVKVDIGNRQDEMQNLEQRTIEMSYRFVGEQKAGKEGAADPYGSMPPDAASRIRNQKICDRSIVNCSNSYA